MTHTALNAVQANMATTILSSVLQDNKPLDRAYSLAFANQQMTPAQLAQITRCVGEIIRRLNLFAYLVSGSEELDMSELANACPPLVSAWHLLHGVALPKFPYCRPIDQDDFEQHLAQAKADPLLWDGCPQWLEDLGQSSLGELWPAQRQALAQGAKRYLRVNLLKCSREQLQAKLASEQIETQTVAGVESALEVLNDSALFKSQAFKDGWFEQQDAGSQLVAQALDVKPGMRVIDACAGAGGKTLHLAAQMQGKGRLLAMDVEQWKLDNLKTRARRGGAHNVETRLIVGSKTIKRLKDSADRLLLDVPCSGLGVLKRNPDTKWRDAKDRLPVLMELQAHIIDSYCRMLKPGGMMVYATCSIMPCENQEQVQRFLANHPEFSLIMEETILPAETGFDGFYLAKLQKQPQ
ncbi:RsmB/NOP family class I SAM-dependent RNA methyltransferase [Shewanella sp. NIFS-20-20]|uniref:RsmB/NOP family class I SAM-dependent RNA methyltransferase n=1 Tax=Shewanella sp. NIFS-20-20 TaxID=2853806 RepID=UPI001C4834EE|nr:RsmB/NOP family class I SAM-dependent RNA methyltransferase [Shewanella sp. NIFS-20-20]MBV7317041.1 RsmB/NOP family class I SAM-dependent RNA methyltransferase [Shewanella sp. NIFS-20-20]